MTSRLDYHVGEDWQNEEGLLKEEGEDQDHLRYLPGDCPLALPRGRARSETIPAACRSRLRCRRLAFTCTVSGSTHGSSVIRSDSACRSRLGSCVYPTKPAEVLFCFHALGPSILSLQHSFTKSYGYAGYALVLFTILG